MSTVAEQANTDSSWPSAGVKIELHAGTLIWAGQSVFRRPYLFPLCIPGGSPAFGTLNLIATALGAKHAIHHDGIDFDPEPLDGSKSTNEMDVVANWSTSWKNNHPCSTWNAATANE